MPTRCSSLPWLQERGQHIECRPLCSARLWPLCDGTSQLLGASGSCPLGSAASPALRLLVAAMIGAPLLSHWPRLPQISSA
eukprot:scaffold276_cov548-Prasinococcus_capsulatus_cf.AAC.4